VDALEEHHLGQDRPDHTPIAGAGIPVGVLRKLHPGIESADSVKDRPSHEQRFHDPSGVRAFQEFEPKTRRRSTSRLKKEADVTNHIAALRVPRQIANLE